MKEVMYSFILYSILVLFVVMYKKWFSNSKKFNYVTTCTYSIFILIFSCFPFYYSNHWLFACTFLLNIFAVCIYLFNVFSVMKVDNLFKEALSTKKNFLFFVLVFFCLAASMFMFNKRIVLSNIIFEMIKLLYIGFIFEIGVTFVWSQKNFGQRKIVNWFLTIFFPFPYLLGLSYIVLGNTEFNIRCLYVLSGSILFILNSFILYKNKTNLIISIFLHVIHDCIYISLLMG